MILSPFNGYIILIIKAWLCRYWTNHKIMRMMYPVKGNGVMKEGHYTVFCTIMVFMQRMGVFFCLYYPYQKCFLLHHAHYFKRCRNNLFLQQFVPENKTMLGTL